ncbi:MAG: hypothetical protein ACO1SV_02990 [Fimbriimonas sp.]
MKTIRLTLAALALTTCASALAFDYNDDPVRATYQVHLGTNFNGFSGGGLRPTGIWANPAMPETTSIMVPMVWNEGTHAKSFVTRCDQTAAQVNAIAADGFRIQDLAAYRKNGVKMYAVLAYHQSGDPAQTKWFDELTSAQLSAQLSSYQGRLLDLDANVVNGETRFSGVMRKNTGDDQIGWYWTPNASTMGAITQFAQTTKARIVDLSPMPNGLYHAVLWKDDQNTMGYLPFTSETFQDLSKKTEYLGMRIQCVSGVKVDGIWRYSGIMIPNKSLLTRKVGAWMRSRTDGDVGLYLRQVDGPVLADLQENTSFYPSSTMKVFMHAKAVSATPVANLMTFKMPTWADHNDPDHAGDTFTWTPLPQVLGPMMWNSSNEMANNVLSYYGTNGTENYVRNTFKLSGNTQINHYLGIGRPYSGNTFNSTTLVDLGKVYEGVHKQFEPARLDFFRKYMLNDANSDGMDAPAIELRESLQITDAQWSAWRPYYTWEAKAGSNSHPTVDISGYSSAAGHMSLPFKNIHGRVEVRKYVFGVWINGAETTNAAGAWGSSRELIRDLVRESLLSFKD